MPNLVLELKVDEPVSINRDRLTLTLKKKSGGKARILVQTDDTISIGKPIENLTRPPQRNK